VKHDVIGLEASDLVLLLVVHISKNGVFAL
jgi:hypothetical protein